MKIILWSYFFLSLKYFQISLTIVKKDSALYTNIELMRDVWTMSYLHMRCIVQWPSAVVAEPDSPKGIVGQWPKACGHWGPLKIIWQKHIKAARVLTMKCF